MKRLCLDGTWEFDLEENPSPVKRFPDHMGHTIHVPGCVECDFPQVTSRQHTLFFRKRFSFHPTPGNRVFLRFQAVDYLAWVFLDGQFLGQHEGGFLPFEWEITSHFDASHSESADKALDVIVFDPILEQPDATPEWDPRTIPHGKQNGQPNWYTNISGIWQSVFVEERPGVFLHDVDFSTRFHGDTWTLHGFFHVDPGGPVQVECILEKAGQTVARTLVALSHGETQKEFSLQVPGVQPWSPEHPHLYRLRLRWGIGMAGNELAFHVGFRELEVRAGRIVLNGEDFTLRGVLDQEFYPQTLYTVPSREFLQQSFSALKQMGFNTLRCHVKVPDPVYMELADEMGLLVWQDVPYTDRFTPQSAFRLEQTVWGTLQRDHHHPSFGLYSLINESWGIDLSRAEQASWLTELFQQVKQRYPDILLVDNSPCGGNVHVRSDLNDFHFYTATLDRLEHWDDFLDSWDAQPGRTFQPGYEENAEGLPRLVSEFGNWSLGAQRWFRESGLPYWAEHRFIDRDAVVVSGALERFEASECSKEFTLEEFIGLSQRAQQQSLKLAVRSLREHPGIRGYVVTEFCDTFWETNGILDFHRQPKVPFEQVLEWNDPPGFLLRPLQDVVHPGEKFQVQLRLLDAVPPGSVLQFLKEGGKLQATVPCFPTLNQPMVLELPSEGLAPGTHRMVARLSSRQEPGWHFDVLVLPHGKPPSLTLHDGFEGEWLERVKRGESAFVHLSPGEYQLAGYRARVLPREGETSGDWIGGFAWAAKELHWLFPGGGASEVHRPLFSGAPLLWSDGWTHRKMGMVFGWMGAFAGYLEEISHGKGTIWVTTLQGEWLAYLLGSLQAKG